MATVCGTGGWSGPLPGDPDNNSLLTATPAFGGIDVSWTYPQINSHAVAHTIVYRGIIPDFMGAIYLTTAAGNFFYDKNTSQVPVEYFYWIRIVSINGTVGELIGPASAIARPTIEQTIEMLTGQIDAGALAQSLKTDLAQISILNTNLLNEITARENSEVTLAAALAAVDAGTAQALTFINQESASRVTADSAQAENLNLVAATLGGDIAAVTTSMTADIDSLTGNVNAMYTAKVNVNGLVGGFGLANNGAEVEAGFDVDKFWVGRSTVDPLTGLITQVKPFIVVGDEVFINQAVINELTFDKLRSADGSLIVEGGKVKAAYLTATEAIIGDLTVTTAKIADAAITNAKIGDAQITNAKIGTAAITSAKIGDLAVNTINIAGGAITESFLAPGSSQAVNASAPGPYTIATIGPFTVPAGQTWQITTLQTGAISASGGGNAEVPVDGVTYVNLFYGATNVSSASCTGSLSVPREDVYSLQHTQTFTSGQSVTISSTVSFSSNAGGGGGSAKLLVLVMKK